MKKEKNRKMLQKRTEHIYNKKRFSHPQLHTRSTKKKIKELMGWATRTQFANNSMFSQQGIAMLRTQVPAIQYPRR